MKNKEALKKIQTSLEFVHVELANLHRNSKELNKYMIPGVGMGDHSNHILEVMKCIKATKKIIDKVCKRVREKELNAIQKKLGLNDKEFAALREEVK